MFTEALEKMLVVLERGGDGDLGKRPSVIAEAIRRHFRIYLSLAPEVEAELKYWCLKDNPDYAEISFFGVGQGHFIDKLYAPLDGFSPKAAAELITLGNGQLSLMGGVDLDERDELINRIVCDGRRQDILFKGHLHPLIFMKVKGREQRLVPDEISLLPSEPDLVAVYEDGFWDVRYDCILA